MPHRAVFAIRLGNPNGKVKRNMARQLPRGREILPAVLTGANDVALTCPMALDAGVTWAAANPEKVDRAFTDEQVGRMAKVCYDPEIRTGTISSRNACRIRYAA